MADLQRRIVYFKATDPSAALSINDGLYIRSVASAQEGGTHTLPDGVTFQIPSLNAFRKFLGLVCDTVVGGTHDPQVVKHWWQAVLLDGRQRTPKERARACFPHPRDGKQSIEATHHCYQTGKFSIKEAEEDIEVWENCGQPLLDLEVVGTDQ